MGNQGAVSREDRDNVVEPELGHGHVANGVGGNDDKTRCAVCDACNVNTEHGTTKRSGVVGLVVEEKGVQALLVIDLVARGHGSPEPGLLSPDGDEKRNFIITLDSDGPQSRVVSQNLLHGLLELSGTARCVVAPPQVP